MEVLDKVIKEELYDLSSYNLGSKEKSQAIRDIVNLHNIRNEEIKRSLDAEREYTLKKEQMKDQDIDRYLKYGIEAIGIVLPLMFYASWMKQGFKFEESGVYTSTTFKGLFSGFKPTKK